MYWYFTEKEIIKQYRGLSPPDFFLYAHIIFSNRCKGPGRIPNLEYFYSDIGKSHNKPSRNTFFSLGMRTRAPRAPVTSVIIGWRNWGYICFRCWQLIQTGANSTLLSPFFLFNMVLLTSLQPPPTTHPLTHSASTQIQYMLTNNCMKTKSIACTQILCGHLSIFFSPFQKPQTRHMIAQNERDVCCVQGITKQDYSSFTLSLLQLFA